MQFSNIVQVMVDICPGDVIEILKTHRYFRELKELTFFPEIISSDPWERYREKYMISRAMFLAHHRRRALPRWLMWDPEGEDRLMVYVMYQNVRIRRGESPPTLVKKPTVHNMHNSTTNAITRASH
jgi:hypothetical protein